MNTLDLRTLINEVKTGVRSVDDALSALRAWPYENLGFARVDHHRALRKGFPEVVFGEGKTVSQIVEIMTRLASQSPRVMVTRANEEAYEAVRKAVPSARYLETARIVLVESQPRSEPNKDDAYVLVASAGTVDVPVAEEAAVTAEVMGSRVERLYDVGVAGLHRLLDQRKLLENANVIIAVAGMDGVLPTIIAGLVESPVIALPTSVGYGTGLGGVAAVLTMLNACAPGIAIVNIDNGFGAGFMAHTINQRNRVRSGE